MECEKFYDKVLKDRNLLHKITSSEKYSWYDPGEIQSLLYVHLNFCMGSVTEV
jgi:hypothetical protein